MKKNSTGQKRPKTTRTSYVSLPKDLVNDIKSLSISKTQVSHCIKFVGILYRDSIADYWDMTIPTPKPQTYLIKTFDDKYYQWLNILIENGIVIRSENYSQSIHQCYTYVVNPKYQSGLINSIESNSSNVLCKEKYSEPLSTLGYKDIIKNENRKDLLYRNWFIKDLNSLNLDYNLLEDIVRERLNRLDLSDFIIDKEITPVSIKVKLDNGKEVFRNTETLLSNIKIGNCLIKDKSIYKVVSPEQFLGKKKVTMLMYYSNSIERLKYNCISVKRNTTNNRLDTNLTNMASVLVDEICRQNDLVQVDLSNSQFTLLTNELSKHLDTIDFKHFRELTSTGTLYAYIAKELGLKNDKNGKQLMFEIMFSNHRNNSAFKKKIKELFPSVLAWIDNYKKTEGDADFSIMLQLKESFLFIDSIFDRIKKKKMLCFSKHDSMIVRSENLEQVIKIMKEEFEKINLDYRLKVTTSHEEYFVFSNDKNEIVEEATKEKTMLQLKYLRHFKYVSPSYTLTPAQFHELTEREYIENVSLIEILNLIKYYNRDGFDYFLKDIKRLGYR